jgi:hypothetical protein
MKLCKKYKDNLYYVMLGEEILYETEDFASAQAFYAKIRVADKHNKLVDQINEINSLIDKLVIQYQDENEDVIKELKRLSKINVQE